MSKLRKIITIDNKDTGRKMSIYRDAEFNEFVVKFFEGGVYLAEADYHTDDSVDAHDTANNWINKRSANCERSVNIEKNPPLRLFCSEYVGKNIEFRGNGLALNIDDCTQAKSAD